MRDDDRADVRGHIGVQVMLDGFVQASVVPLEPQL
jgi:hypothetical protein